MHSLNTFQALHPSFIIYIVGHAQTFWIAHHRARQYHGDMLLRIEDIDVQRCKPSFLTDMMEDLQWFGLRCPLGYQRGPQQSVEESEKTKHFIQSKRFPLYEAAWKLLYERGYIYPCKLSRKDVDQALSAPHDAIDMQANGKAVATPNFGDQEVVFPSRLRPDFIQAVPYGIGNNQHYPATFQNLKSPYDLRINWRFRVPDVEDEKEAKLSFDDVYFGEQTFHAGKDFGDFLVWRLDGYPSYELAVIVDDLLMKITEVVRGQDLLLSTGRQLLLIKALFGLDWNQPTHWMPLFPCEKGQPLPLEDQSDAPPPEDVQLESNNVLDYDLSDNILFSSTHHNYLIPRYFHAPLVVDENGVRLAKRNFSKSLRKLREEGVTPTMIREQFLRKTL